MSLSTKQVALLIGLGGISLTTSFFWFNKPAISINPSLPTLSQPTPTPTPHPISIPGIRDTQIADTTITLESIYQTHPSYKSYLASYHSQGFKINGLLTLPTTPEPVGGFPAIVFLHGYIPPNEYKTTQKYVDHVNYLASRNIIVFKIDYRGHADSEGEPSGAYFSADYVLDTLAAINALKQLPSVNSNQLGLWAHSMSGNIALRAAVASPNIKAVVIWAGAVYSYTDRLKYGLNDNSFRRNQLGPNQIIRRSQNLIAQYGDANQNPEFWNQIAPTHFLQDTNAAIQLHHATDDSVVNIGYSQDLAQLLKQNNVIHEFYSYPSGGHNITGNSFSTAMARTVSFYQQYLR